MIGNPSPGDGLMSGGDPENPDLKIAWNCLYASKPTWLGAKQDLGCCGSVYNLTMDPFEEYDMTFKASNLA